MRQWMLSNRLNRSFILIAIYSYSTFASAAAFQLWEQDGASIGNYHAGYAAAAEDASTAFYNPAGLTRFKNQQLVVAGTSVLTNFKYKGTVAVSTLADPSAQPVTAQGGGFGFVPALHYVAPLTERLAFGFSIAVPFGLMTNYGSDTILKYAATKTSIETIDVSPTLAYKINKNASVGLGPDLQYARGEFDQVGVLFFPQFFADGINKADGTSYGYHGGVLYEVSDNTRFGLSYHSQVVHHLTGTSELNGPLLQAVGAGSVTSKTAYINVTLPPYTALSFFHRNKQVALMGSAILTQWSSIRELILHNVAGIENAAPTTSIVVTIPQYFRNTWNLTAGANYYVTDTVTLRGGLGYDQTPVGNTYRNVQMPDNDRYVVALGGHFKASETVALDVSWAHIFVPQSSIAPPSQVSGDEVTTTVGHVKGGADVFGAQVTWNLA